MDLINTYKILYLKRTEHIFFSSEHGMVFRIDHMLGHKTNVNKFKKTEIVSSQRVTALAGVMI